MQTHIDNKLSNKEKDHFFEHGYLVIENAIDASLLDKLDTECQKLSNELHSEFLNEANILNRDDAFLELLTLPSVLPKIVGLLGWNIWVNHTHINVHPPISHSELEGFEYGWHRDGGIIEQDLGNETPWFSIKVGFQLTNTDDINSGATICIPGSHKDHREIPSDSSLPPESSITLSVPAGSAILMNPRIIHSVRSPNLQTFSRKVVFIQWAYRWLQPLDRNTINSKQSSIDDPLLNQLLGLTNNPEALNEKYARGRSGCYYPNDEEVPLKQYAFDLYESYDKQNFSLRTA